MPTNRKIIMKKSIFISFLLIISFAQAQEFNIAKEKFYQAITDDQKIGTSIGLFLNSGTFITYSNTNIQHIAKFSTDMDPQWIKHYGYYNVYDPQPWKTQISIQVQSIVDAQLLQYNSYEIAGFYSNANTNLSRAFFTNGEGSVTGFFIDTVNFTNIISNMLYAGRVYVENAERFYYFGNSEKIGNTTYLKIRKESSNAIMVQNTLVDSTLGTVELSRLFQKGNYIDHVLLYKLDGEYRLSVTKTDLKLETVSHTDFALPSPPESRMLKDVSILEKNFTKYSVVAKANVNSTTSKMIYVADADCSDNSVKSESISIDDYFDLNGAIIDDRENIIAGGSSVDYKTSFEQFELIAIDKNLNLKCTKKWSYQASSIQKSIAYNGTDILVSGFFYDTTDTPSTTYFAKLRYNDGINISAADESAAGGMNAYCESGRLYIGFASPVGIRGNATVTGQLGNTIAKAQIDGYSAEIDLSAHPSGVYFLNVAAGGKSYTAKFIKE